MNLDFDANDANVIRFGELTLTLGPATLRDLLHWRYELRRRFDHAEPSVEQVYGLLTTNIDVLALLAWSASRRDHPLLSIEEIHTQIVAAVAAMPEADRRTELHLWAATLQIAFFDPLDPVDSCTSGFDNLAEFAKECQVAPAVMAGWTGGEYFAWLTSVSQGEMSMDAIGSGKSPAWYRQLAADAGLSHRN